MSENSGMFERIFLQEAPINHLKVSFAKGRTSQTYLFVGKESCGKFKTALAFAALLQCDNPVYDGKGRPDACGRCDSCKRVAALSHPDVQVIKPDGYDIRISQIRRMQDLAQLKSSYGKWQIFIIDPAEKLNISSANSLLKILEEAPSQTVFILIGKSADSVIPTILSRSELVRFNSPGHESARKAVVEATGLSEEKAALCYSLSEGRFGKSLLIAQTFEGLELSRGMRASHTRYLNCLETYTKALRQKFSQVALIEEALVLAGDLDNYFDPELQAGQKSFCRALFTNTGLPYAFPILFSEALLDKLENCASNLKKGLEPTLADLKKSCSSAMYKEIEGQLFSAVDKWPMMQLEGLFLCLINFYSDALLMSCGADETLMLNIDCKDDIITLAKVEGTSLLRGRIEMLESAVFMLHRHVQPLLILENLMTQIGGAEA
ncbi:DNA polymerase III subunit [bacterium]|nr:DNA polymerase III subunit [bacterium]